jgi:hypothetical protein
VGVHLDREHAIPLRRADLVDLLCREPKLTDAERQQFRELATLVAALFHFEYHESLEKLKCAYAPFDPDRITKTIKTLTEEEREERLNALVAEFVRLMQRANFKRLDIKDLEKAMKERSEWGIQMDVDLTIFDRLAGFVLGDSIGIRTRKRWWKLWRLEEVRVPVYQRFVLLLKLKPTQRLDADLDTRDVFIKMFKDIPKADIEMLLPGSKVKMTRLDAGKITFPILSGIGLILWKLLQAAVMGVWTLITLAFGLVGYGVRSYFSYQTTKQQYSLRLTRSLYYQNLDNNAGVLHRVVDAAEEQECKEALLAYFFLWQQGGEHGFTLQQVDELVELYLETEANIVVDFEITDAMDKLKRLGLVEPSGSGYRAVPITQALERLDYRWDHLFQYNQTLDAAPPATTEPTALASAGS